MPTLPTGAKSLGRRLKGRSYSSTKGATRGNDGSLAPPDAQVRAVAAGDSLNRARRLGNETGERVGGMGSLRLASQELVHDVETAHDGAAVIQPGEHDHERSV